MMNIWQNAENACNSHLLIFFRISDLPISSYLEDTVMKEKKEGRREGKRPGSHNCM